MNIGRILRCAIGVVMIATYATALPQGLVVHYPLDGDAQDASGNGHDGAVVGATPTSDRFGNPNGALHFDGNDYVSIPDDASLSFGSDSITMMAWVRRSQASSDSGYYMMGHSNGGGNSAKWIFWLGNGSLSLVMYPTGGSHWFGCGSYAFTDTWYHVAIRKDGNQLTGFVNGDPLQGGSSSAPGSFGDPTTPMFLGTAEGGHPGRVLRGDLDEVRIYRRALSDVEIRGFYDCGTVVNYCTAKTNSLGCSPALTMTGLPKVSAVSGCMLSTINLLGGSVGIYIHSTTGSQAQPFHGGLLCILPQITRHAPAGTAGTVGSCDGMLSEDFNAYIASGLDSNLVAGATVWLQAWSRDPADPLGYGDSLSDAVWATICP